MTLDISNYGIKVVKNHKDTSSTDLRDFILHSDYSMFKFDHTLSGQISIATGQTVGTLTKYHNLGYIPAFWFYEDGILMPKNIKAYVDDEKIVLTKTIGSAHNYSLTQYQANQIIYQFYSGIFGGLPVFVGKLLGSTNNSAFWFENIYVNQGQTIISANLRLESIGCLGTNPTKGRYWGVDEDNTSDLGGGYPGGRPKTDAYYDHEARITYPGGFNRDLPAVVQEIVNRGGWSNGNHMCFMLEDNSSPDGSAVYCTNPPSLSNILLDLTIQTGTDPLTTDIDIIVCKDKIAD